MFDNYRMYDKKRWIVSLTSHIYNAIIISSKMKLLTKFALMGK